MLDRGTVAATWHLDVTQEMLRGVPRSGVTGRAAALLPMGEYLLRAVRASWVNNSRGPLSPAHQILSRAGFSLPNKHSPHVHPQSPGVKPI